MLPRVSFFCHLPCAGFGLTKIIIIFFESTNIRRLKILMTADLHLYTRCLHTTKFENQSPLVDKQVIRI